MAEHGSTGAIASTTAPIDFDQARQHRQEVRGRRWRRLAIAAAVALVALAVYGVAGPRQAAMSSTAGGYAVEVSYPSVTRGGMPARWSLEIARLDGSAIAGAVDVETTGSYLDQFDFQGLTPEPLDVASTAEAIHWRFDPGEHSSLLVVLDVRVQPNVRWRHHASSVVSVDGVVVATFEYSTLVLP